MDAEPEEIVIVGAGIAGLTVAEGLLKRGHRVILLERYPNVGGRIVTNRDPQQYEIGAGRIFHAHKRTLDLVKRFKLHTYAMSNATEWRSAADPENPSLNTFQEFTAALIPVLESLKPSELAQHTLTQLIPASWHPILKQYPYWAELNLMRADLALEAFKPGGEMSTYDHYYGVAEGLDAITTKLAAAVMRAGATILTRHRVADIRKVGREFLITGDFGKKAEAKPFEMRAKQVIIATCRCSLSTFSVLKGKPLLNQLQTSPLLRIYAVYPKGRNGKVWFDGMSKTVTDSPLRFVIPINPKSGLIMISYTDGPADTKKWRALEGAKLQTEIQKEVKALFGAGASAGIPEPTYLKKHDWPAGCTYWTPGRYGMEKAVREAMNPMKNLFVVGESVSEHHQAWIEGALESAELFLEGYKQ